MIEYINGSIFNSQCQAIVNTVNCVKIMGKGLALQFKQKFPEMYWDYREECNKGNVVVGKMHIWKWGSDRFIINFPTKQHWRNPSKIEWIVSGLEDLAKCVKELDIKSIGIPALGTGLGGLHLLSVKEEIEKTHEKHWQDLKVEVYIF